MGSTLFDKVWESHVARRADGLPDLLYVDLHLVHEVTSPQAFESLRLAGRKVRRPDLTLATMDHNVATGDDTPMDPLSEQDRKSTRLNSSHEWISYAVFCSKKKKEKGIVSTSRCENEGSLNDALLIRHR